MKSNTLVTGASGVLGSALKKIISNKKTLKKNFIFISSKELNLLNSKDTYKFFKKKKIKNIIHLAAVSGGMGVSGKNFQAKMFRDNLQMLLNILEVSKNLKIKKILLTLSSGMYSPNLKMPYKEETIHDGKAHQALYGYFYAKRMMEPAINAYRDQYKMNIIGLVPNGIFGENDNFNILSAPLVPSLINKFWEAKVKNETVEIWGDGNPLREWTYAPDMAKAFLWCFKNYNKKEIINVGTNEENPIKKIAFLIADIMKVKKDKIVFNKSKKSGVFRKSMDNSKFLKISKFKFTKFREALVKTIHWYEYNKKFFPDKIKSNSRVRN